MSPVLSYAESSTLGLHVLRNMAILAAGPFSPWLDSVPARLLLASTCALLLIQKGHVREKLLAPGLFVPPLVKVSNLTPRSDFIHSALPAAAIAVLRLPRVPGSGVLFSGILVGGSMLAARDEFARLDAASRAAGESLDALCEMHGSLPESTVVILSGLSFEEAGYGTIWPDAYEEALRTRGLEGGPHLFDQDQIWELAWPDISSGEELDLVFARLCGGTTRTVSLTIQPGRFPDGLPEIPVEIGCCGRIVLGPEHGMYATLSAAPATSEAILLVPDLFEPCSLVALLPFGSSGETVDFDLSSQPAWLASSGAPFTIRLDAVPEPRTVLLSSRELWLPALESFAPRPTPPALGMPEPLR